MKYHYVWLAWSSAFVLLWFVLSVKPWMIDRANDHYALDITRARTLLGWKPKRSLRGTLPKMVAALKADPLGWYRENDLEPSSELVERTERHPT